ncbi:MAG: VWA domain-containing protein, partial [bacterium]|nr:VWA domain-containing protein [bacterium]
VTVTGRRGRRALELVRQDFEMLDQEIPQKIVTFARGDIPFTAVLLLDGSFSMKGERLETVLQGARRFVDDMKPLDEAKLIAFSDRPLRITPFVGDGESLAGALARTSATGGTAILDHLHMALMLLEARQGRRVVILLTDGWDPISVLTPSQVKRIARRSQALIYWVRLRRDEPSAGNRLRERGRLIPLSSWHTQETSLRIYKQLEGIVRASGGRIVPISKISEVEATFREILTELREQYALGYYPEPRRNDGSWRKVRVLLPGRELNVRTREGYVDW